jgi:hypothetical protein
MRKISITTYVAALTAVLILGTSEASLAAKRTSRTSVVVKQQQSNSTSGIRSYNQEPHKYRYDDPYASGVNWPGHW